MAWHIKWLVLFQRTLELMLLTNGYSLFKVREEDGKYPLHLKPRKTENTTFFIKVFSIFLVLSLTFLKQIVAKHLFLSHIQFAFYLRKRARKEVFVVFRLIV